MKEITIIKPDDWHLHLRDGVQMQNVVNMTAKQMGRAVIMPNLSPPIITTSEALAYKSRIINSINGFDFTPLMTLYLTDNTDINEIKKAKQNGIIGVKLYPANATTNSAIAVKNITNIYKILEEMQKFNLPLLIHGEVADKEVDVFDREAVFIDKYLIDIVNTFPELRIVFEHISTIEAVNFVLASSNKVAATITPQHLLSNRNDMLSYRIQPHYFCLPILKRKNHQQALVKAAISGNKKFFLGTDSAPHSKQDKESYCGCAGVFSAPFAIELYTEVFDKANALDKLENFASKFGADFYQLPYNDTKITLIKDSWKIANQYKFGSDTIVPFMHGRVINWRLL